MTATLSSSPGVCLCFDFGEARVGVAVGNSLTRTAQALQIIHAQDNNTRFACIADCIREWSPDALVVGIPRHPDGQPNAMTARCERFARQLEGRFAKPVHCVDERYTSVEAASRVTRGGREAVDDVAACIILEQFFSSLPTTPERDSP